MYSERAGIDGAYGAAENKSLEIKTLRPRRVPRC